MDVKKIESPPERRQIEVKERPQPERREEPKEEVKVEEPERRSLAKA